MLERASVMRWLAILFLLGGGSQALTLSLLIIMGKMTFVAQIVRARIDCTYCPRWDFPPSLGDYQLLVMSLWMVAGLTGILSVLLLVLRFRFIRVSSYISLLSALVYLIGWASTPRFQAFYVASYQVYALLEVGPTRLVSGPFSALLLTPVVTLATGGIVALSLARTIMTSHGRSLKE